MRGLLRNALGLRVEGGPDLYERERAMQDLWGVIDRINAKCGVDTVYMAPMHGERGSAPRRIPFGKPPDLRLVDVDE